MKSGLIAASLIAAAAVVIGLMVQAWTNIGPVDIPLSGMLALVAGVILALVVGCGLMALLFYSSRSGHDDGAGR